MLNIPKDKLKMLIWLALFGIGFGYVEAAVVVYLRALFYPAGFDIPMQLGFPFIYFGTTPFLQPVPMKILLTEVGRETATILMLFSIAMFSGTNFRERIAFFLWPFAVWDIFYYVFLKVLIGWPATLGTLDVLFLIPVPWLAPVYVPIAASIFMLVLSSIILSSQKSNS